ncbi:MAG: hypothetical protein KF700_11935 [Hyphomonadaceae bacterium]|nr:hypothetical protein [Hyphomonadaceae bacterium]
MANKSVDYGQEIRETIVKSGLTGVAATVLAVTLASPAGFGGMIGTSLASGAGATSGSNASENPYARLPAYPAPLTPDEVSEIRGQLAATAASLEFTRAATEEKVELVRNIAMGADLTMIASVSAPDSVVAPRLAPAAQTPAVAQAAPIEPPVVSFAAPLHDPHLELAALLLNEDL